MSRSYNLLSTFVIFVVLSLSFYNTTVTANEINQETEGQLELIDAIYVNLERIDSIVNANEYSDLSIIKEELLLKKRIKSRVKYLEKSNVDVRSELDSIQKLTLFSYLKLSAIDTFYKEWSLKQDRLETEYYRSWNDVFQLKGRVENLFIETKEYNFNFGGLDEKESVKINKRHLYNAMSEAYKYDLKILKNIKQCDYKDRIRVLSHTKELLVKSEDILFDKNTKALEKSLKNIEDPKVLGAMILEYEPQE
ncbi:MAG: hypothetical protein AAF363_22215 [Bacteroidota bacterium]